MENELGNYLMLSRTRLGLSMAEASKKTGIHRSYLWMLEHGKRKNINSVMIFKLASGYGIPSEQIIEHAGLSQNPTEEADKIKKADQITHSRKAWIHMINDPDFNFNPALEKSEIPEDIRSALISVYTQLKVKMAILNVQLTNNTWLKIIEDNKNDPNMAIMLEHCQNETTKEKL